MNPNSTSRIPSLDGLRAVSIVLVIASHAVRGFGYREFGNIGDLGVRIFFVISGFLITGLLIKELDRTEKISLWKFYFRRTLRIFPPYYFFLLVIVALVLLGRLQIDLGHFWAVFTYTSDYIYPKEWIVDHAWSLSVEEQFYLIYPGILVLMGRRGIERLLAATLILCPILRFIGYDLFHQLEPSWLTKGFHANLDTLAIGSLLALKYDALHKNRFYLALLSSRLTFALPVIIFVINTQIDYTGLNLGILFSINNALIAIFIDWAVTNFRNPIGVILNSRPLVVVGMMSYSLYIWQQPFVDPDPQSKLFAFPLNILGFIACSCFSYFVIERLSLIVRRRYEGGRLPVARENLIATAVEA